MGEMKCPKGSYLDVKCNGISNPVCKTCPRHTFTDEENNMKECRACRECTSNSNLELVKECAADKNTECKCKPRYYCPHAVSDSHCDHCSPVSTCLPGKGVTHQYTFQRDTVCKPCPEGTYSDVEDHISSCKNHTSCEDLGRKIEVAGTSTSDVVCGPIQTACSWVLPASLWAGIIVTALIVFLVLFIMYWRNKHHSKRSEISSNPILPMLPPDILKHPADFDMEICAECDKHKADNYTDMDSGITCKGDMPMMMSAKYSQSTAEKEYTERRHDSLYPSQPQESEWNDEL
ncbi:tumor necrosis factor receptor superfamily member 5 isoform X2 [Pimephales promelas]|uniref:tumor necrosis factor receptor superfamily member 5 isoform X2 n=1 Tax=Pimephales promelas TaxID=90988 RepID=UPI0019559D1C|nr:tumor necrosis factor receptor superfamily member 5 isoform X2 [Pimephales promelas]KAG1948019.1 tumor necrosis factor receptor superfamily [Pimephales promelas]